jgi:hypothetical protein
MRTDHRPVRTDSDYRKGSHEMNSINRARARGSTAPRRLRAAKPLGSIPVVSGNQARAKARTKAKARTNAGPRSGAMKQSD